MARTRPYEQAPPRALRVFFLLLCTVGICLSADLIRLHVRVHTDPDYHSYCAISEQVNCETVAHHPSSVFLGLPVAVWGVLGYALMGVLAAWGLRRRLPLRSWPFGILLWLAAFSTVASVAMFLVSWLVVRSGCIVCMGTYTVNALLVVTAWLELRKAGAPVPGAVAEELRAVRERPLPLATILGLLLVATAVLWAAVPAYWRLETTTGPGGLPVGVTESGHHWIGAAKPVLEIVEYSDHQCPFCQRGHAAMRQLIEQNPGRVRLVHRHFPLDRNCNPRAGLHPHACRYAYLAHCAGEQGRFWEASDYLYEHGRRREPVTASELAGEIGVDAGKLSACLQGPGARSAVSTDLAAGWKLNIQGTPTFVVKGRIYPGAIPPEVLEAALGSGGRGRSGGR